MLVCLLLALVLAAAAIALLRPRTTPHPPVVQHDPVSGEFNDEFSGSSLDPAWTREKGPGYGLGTFEATPDLTRLDGQGHLVVSAQKQPDGQWHAGMVSTRRSFTLNSGVIEVRAKVPRSQGAWPAIWLINTLQGKLHSEIDMMENVSGSKTLYSTIHDWTVDPQKGYHKEADLSPGWHTYRLTWTPTSIAFALDGKSMGQFTSSTIKPWVYTEPLFIVLDVAVGGSWAGPPDASTPDRLEMLVDYVRVRPLGGKAS